MDVVQLDVLAGRDVADSVGVLFSHVRQNIHLLRAEAAEWNLDALHPRGVPDGVRAFGRGGWERQAPVCDTVVALTVVVALTIGAPAQPGFAEQLVLDLALFLELDLALKYVDLARQIGGHDACETFFPASQWRRYP